MKREGLPCQKNAKRWCPFYRLHVGQTFIVIIPPDPILSHILTDESADAETMIVFISALFLDTCIVMAATELTAPSWPSRIAHTFHYEKHKHTEVGLHIVVISHDGHSKDYYAFMHLRSQAAQTVQEPLNL